MDMPDEVFKDFVAEALGLIPSEFREHLDNVEVIIEEEPRAEVMREMRLRPGRTLFGLYTGIPLTGRSHDPAPFPDRITLFRKPLLAHCEDMEELRYQVVTTVLHEVAHHFGIGEARLSELGWG
ncbi:MAG: metallopeptidase family protein [Holophagaceae bacterium]|nr:metallopeptidase family protein [Holophagaceae bacterium]